MKKFLSENPFDNIKCHCGFIIPQQIIIDSFGSQAIYQNEKEKAADFLFGVNESTFACGICMVRFKVAESITLDCDHRYCGQCMQDYFKERIMSSNVSAEQFTCPECGEPVSHTIIQGVVSKEIFEKYENFAFRNWRPEEGNIVKICHICEAMIEIPINLKRLKCYGCGTEYCPQCNKDHPPDITCEEFEEERFEEDNEKQWVNEGNMKKKNNNKKGNKEGAVVRKNSVKAYADQGKNNQKKIEEAKKKSHGEDARQNIKEVVKRAESAPRLIKGDKNKKLQEEKKNLDFIAKNFTKCPKCKTPVEKESGCNFMKCRWPGCKDSYFCLLCNKALTVIDKQINDHYTHYRLSGPFGKTCNTMDGGQ